MENWREWLAINAADITAAETLVERDEHGIDYEVRVSLGSLTKGAYEEGEGQVTVWSRRVEFGKTAARSAGGGAFVEAAREQDAIADAIAKAVWR